MLLLLLVCPIYEQLNTSKVLGLWQVKHLATDFATTLLPDPPLVSQREGLQPCNP